ncbi:MAG: hypothetical protein LBQ59_00990 [Candidatus Peribacteria bacterium]|jgi:hypothetical protein|nr:hypothetical protein [Candidatus Peribacteria bacterium]
MLALLIFCGTTADSPIVQIVVNKISHGDNSALFDSLLSSSEIYSFSHKTIFQFIMLIFLIKSTPLSTKETPPCFQSVKILIISPNLMVEEMFSKFFSKFKYSGLKKSASNLCASRMS